MKKCIQQTTQEYSILSNKGFLYKKTYCHAAFQTKKQKQKTNLDDMRDRLCDSNITVISEDTNTTVRWGWAV